MHDKDREGVDENVLFGIGYFCVVLLELLLGGMGGVWSARGRRLYGYVADYKDCDVLIGALCGQADIFSFVGDKCVDA